ncbi:MAG TPA: hypothetical protein VF192_18035 [Longimicrobiales bacterium]
MAVREEIERARGGEGPVARRPWLPTPADVLFLAIGVLGPVLAGGALLNADGDVARHIRLGEWMIEARAVIDRDLFSFTRAGEPFLDFEWLSQVIYAAAHRAGGLPAVAAFAGLLLGAAYALLYRFLRGQGVDTLLALGATVLGALCGMLHWLARPHLFSILATVLLLGLLERPGRHRLVPIALLFALWANLHGGFLFGLILIALYAAGEAMESWLDRDAGTAWRRRLRDHAAAFLVAAVATLANPAGPRLLAHVVSFFGDDVVLDATLEFRSPDFHEPHTWPLLLALLLVLAALALRRGRPPLPWLLVILVTAAFALFAARNAALFGITAVPLAAMAVDADWRRADPLARARRALAFGDAGGRLGPWAAVGAALLLLLVLRGGEAWGRRLLPASFDPARFPVAAVAAARAAGLEGRIFNEFAWGGYLVYAWPEQRVFIDGQTDHYGADLVRDYLRVAGLAPDWRAVLDRWRIEHVLVPARSRLRAQLAREPGWRIAYCDATAVLLTRRPGPTIGRIGGCAPDPAG